MNSPDILTTPVATDERSQDHSRYPDSIILNIGYDVQQYHLATADVRDYEHHIDDVLNDILNYIAVAESAAVGIAALQKDMLSCYDRPDCEPEAKQAIADAVLALATAVHDQLVDMGIYDKDGILRYKLAQWPDEHSVIITKVVAKMNKSFNVEEGEEMTSGKIHHTRGVYASGDFKDNGVAHANLKEHIAYNLHWRPGRALFVDGRCQYPGNLEEDACKEIERKLKKNPVHMKVDTAPYK